MSEGTRIERLYSSLSEVDKQIQTDAAIKTAERESEQAQVNVARGRKTYEGTTIKARNPIIVTMIIMSVVTDALKDSADKTKEITKLEKRIWKHYSDGQSANFKQGESCQKKMMFFKVVGTAITMVGGSLGKDEVLFQDRGLFTGRNYLNSANLKASGNMVQSLGDTIFPQAQQQIQIEDVKFQYKVGHTSSDYQNQSQQVASDNQQVDSAIEKGIQLSRLMVQLITAQPV
ncbi:MAG: hypothetical protein P0S93_00045 [Candidatus Neptunochlamydia sp.]|nr:hypothetical protein [Candidatus Neptunochlamydia sp.]